MDIPTGLILEGLVALLLVTTIAYCWVLDRKLKAIREGQDGMRDLVTALHKATEAARRSIGELHEASRKAGLELDGRVRSAQELGEELRTAISDGQTKARALADELSIMVEAGNNLAERLDTKAAARAAHRPAAAVQRKPRAAGPVPGPVSASGAVPSPAMAAAGRSREPADVPALQQKLMDALRRGR